jgi:hypothetical protein
MTYAEKIYRFETIEKKSFVRNEVMMDLLFGVNPISDNELRCLIAKNPVVYGKYERFVGVR